MLILSLIWFQFCQSVELQFGKQELAQQLNVKLINQLTFVFTLQRIQIIIFGMGKKKVKGATWW